MTYRELFNLKFTKKIPTFVLEKKFPQDKGKISKLALLELPLRTLKKVIHDQRQLSRLLNLKKTLSESLRIKPA